jgi:hypothetical protein
MTLPLELAVLFLIAIDEVLEYEPENLVPNIDDHIFGTNKADADDVFDDDDDETVINLGERVQLTRLFLIDLVDSGWKKRIKMNVWKVRIVPDKWLLRKRKTTQYIMHRVAAMKEEMIATTIPLELDEVEEGVWVTYLRQLRYNYYN